MSPGRSGCKPIRPDHRDKKFTKVAFGAPLLPTFPKTLGRPRRKVKDQNGSQSCTAHATTLAAEYQDQEELSAAFTWSRICKALNNFSPDGADPRTAMSVGHDIGYLPQSTAVHSFPQDSDIAGDWRPYGPFFLEKAEPFKKAAYIRIPKVGDWFDTIRTALLRGQAENQVVMAFGPWREGWAEKIIPNEATPAAGWHAFVFIDFDTVDGTQYLILQNSYGNAFGDHGFQYMPRSVINRDFALWGTGLFVFRDLTPEQIELAKEETPFGQIQRAILQIWWMLAMRFGLIH